MTTIFKLSIVFIFCIWFSHPNEILADVDRLIEDELQMARSEGVDSESLSRLMTAVERLQAPDAYTVKWLSLMRHANEDKLPTAPLVNKIEEGASKKITPSRINAALEQMMTRLQFTNKLTAAAFVKNPSLTTKERYLIMIRMSELLSAGLTQNEMKNLFRIWGSANLQQKLDAMTFYTVSKQAGLLPAEANKIASAGIAHNHFHGFPLDLAMMIKAAKANQINSATIVEHALKVIRGEETVIQSHRRMGIQRMHPNPVQMHQGPTNPSSINGMHTSSGGNSGDGNGNGGGGNGNGGGGNGNGGGGNGNGGGGDGNGGGGDGNGGGGNGNGGGGDGNGGGGNGNGGGGNGNGGGGNGNGGGGNGNGNGGR